MAIEVRHEFILPETVKITAAIYNDSDALVNPTGVTITITSPTGVVVVNDVAMTNDSTGIYTYLFRTTISTTNGQYTEKVTATDGAGALAIITMGTDTFKLR
ncbi:MAG: hypothetical protein WC455_16305 [Dehalococcoidia bacterium]|jgi:uncharacterized protein YfaS (alpha-2-macroglobulin family)